MPRLTGGSPADAVDGGPPSGAAGGVLNGTYPNPGFAVNMATQAELDAHIAASPLDHPDASVTDAKLAEDYIKADGSRDFTDDQSMGGNFLTNVPTPTEASHAVNKAYVDLVAVGGVSDVHLSVRAASTANLTLANEQTVDGVDLVDGDRVLVKNQTDAEDNGIYVVVNGGAWTRATDADSAGELTAGSFTFVEEGTANADTGWLLITDAPITIGTTEQSWAKFSAAGVILPGAGLTQTGQTFDVGVDDATLEINSDALRVKALGIDTAHLAADAVATAKIEDGAITTAKIADGDVTDAKLETPYIKADGTRAFTGTQSMGGTKLTSLADPTAAQDAVTKVYADAIASGLSLKVAVRLATAAALAANTYDNGTAGVGATLTANANGALSVDGVAVAVGNRILVKDEVTGANNGVYTVTATGSAGAPYILTRATDGDTSAELFQGLYFATAGTANTGLAFYLSNTSAPTVGTDALSYAQWQSGGTNGNGVQVAAPLSKAGNTLGLAAVNSLTGKATPVDADNVVISDSAASHVAKKLTWANLKATLWVAISALTGKATPVDADTLVISDSAASNVGKSLTWANVKATLKTYFDTLYGTKGLVSNVQSGTSYTLVLSDAGKMIECTNASAFTLTIPANASVAFDVGTVINVYQGGLGQVTVAITSDTLKDPNGAKTANVDSVITLWKQAATTWVLSGDSTS